MEYKGELNNLINILLISFICIIVAFNKKSSFKYIITIIKVTDDTITVYRVSNIKYETK